ncbi:MAG TPA: hypothetical protein VEC12_13610 [Bacteroidia bacterium]|nr:hypothetical protein [Bacteroidia bacterium]
MKTNKVLTPNTMRRLFTFPLALLFTALAFKAGAQHSLGIYLNGSTAQNQLRDSGYRDGVGFSVEYLSPSLLSLGKRFEVRVGAGFEFLHYGTSRRVENLVMGTPNNDLGSVKLQNQMVGFYVAPKFIFNTGNFSPYFDVFAAIRGFNSYQVTRLNQEVEGYERNSSKSVLENGVGQWGGSLGLLYHLNSNISFDARVSYSTGGTIKFTDLNSVMRNPDMQSDVKYRNITSPVSDLLVFRIGVLFRLKKCTDCTTRYTPEPENNIIITPSRPAPKPVDVRPVPKPAPPVNY